MQLYDFIGNILGTSQNKKIIEIGTKILQYVMDDTKKHIWLPRCEKLKTIEKNYGITKKDKKKVDTKYCIEKQKEILKRPNNEYGRYNGLEGVKEYILFGKDFTVVVNQVGKINYSNTTVSCCFH